MTHYRKCIKITARDSPNVAFALWQIGRGERPDGRVVVPGVLSWQAYCKNLATFTKQERVQSLEADWYEGAEEFLCPREWITFANEFAKRRPKIEKGRGRKWMGVDSGGGGDKSAWVIGDEWGVVDLLAKKTPDTNEVYGITCMKAREWSVAWCDVWFDYGGGGKQHVDRMRASGFMVNGVDFGGQIKTELKRGMTQFTEKKDVEEERAAFDKLRSEMAWDVRELLERPAPLELLDPEVRAEFERQRVKPEAKREYALPLPMCEELCRQLGLIPMRWDERGRFFLLPKTNKTNPDDPKTLKSIVGHSPDEFDAFCCMVHGMLNRPIRITAGTS